MITQIYSPIQIPILEEKLNRDIHYKISRFLGLNHNTWIYLNLTSSSRIPYNTKKIILDLQSLNYNNENINYIFQQNIIDNLHNIVEIHKILALLYRKSKFYNNLDDEFKWLDYIVKDGYEITKSETWDDYDDNDELIGTVEQVTQTTYKIHEKDIINDITYTQFILSILSNNVDINISINNNTPSLLCKLKYKKPSETKIIRYCKKIQSEYKTEYIYHYY